MESQSHATGSGRFSRMVLDITWIMGVMTGRDAPYGRRVAPLPLPCGDRGEERGEPVVVKVRPDRRPAACGFLNGTGSLRP